MKLVETKAAPYHTGQLARTLRAEHRDLLSVMGVPTHHELREAFDASILNKAWLLNGSLAALAGLRSSLGASDGIIWFAMTDELARHPTAVARHALAYLREVMDTRRRVSTIVLENDSAGLRFALFLGFLTEGRQTLNGEPVRLMSYGMRKVA